MTIMSDLNHYESLWRHKRKKITNDFFRKFRFFDEVFASLTLKIPFALHSKLEAIISRVPAIFSTWSMEWFGLILETELGNAWPIKTSKCRSWWDWAWKGVEGTDIIRQSVRITNSNRLFAGEGWHLLHAFGHPHVVLDGMKDEIQNMIETWNQQVLFSF